MSEITLFGSNNPLANSDLYKELQEEINNKLLSGSGGSVLRLSIKGSRFRLFQGGEQQSISEDNHQNLIILNSAPLSRMYYPGKYSAESATPPSCWSLDTETPAPEVLPENRQADRCADCPMNVKGSGEGDTRACRFGQRIAVALEGDMDKVYQFHLPATSVFGETKDNKMPLHAYARFLTAHNTPAIAIVTQVYFDTESDVPKVFFRPVRPLSEEELTDAIQLKDRHDTIAAITITVSQADNVPPAGPNEGKPARAARTQEAKDPIVTDAGADPDGTEEDEIPEPVKAPSTKATKPVVKDEALSQLVADWDD